MTKAEFQKTTTKPEKVNILGVPYTIEYVDKPSDVDIHKRYSYFGQIDYWTRTIRIYDGGRPTEDIWVTIIHEVLHGLSDELKLILKEDEHHDDLGVLAMAITDVLFRNGWINV